VKIAKHYRPELVVSKGKEPNPLLTDPYLDSKAERLISANGHGLVALPVETEKDERSRYLACNLLKAARSFGEPLALAEIEDQEVVEYGVLWPTAQERTFPEWKKLVPKWARGSPGTFTFALDPALLARMANAMGLGGVCLTVELGRPEGQPSPIIVQPLNDRGEELGLLMPMDVNGGGEGGVGPECVCPACGKLLAAGAPCPKHGTPSEAKRALLEGDANVILKNGGSAHLTKGSGGISTTVTLRTPGRPDITTTPEQLKAGLDELKRRKSAKKGGGR
jgi:hypothetical protein